VCAGLVIAGIAAFVEASSHPTEYICTPRGEVGETCTGHYLRAGHLTQTPYDLLRIGAWALVIFGGLLVVTGLIRYWRSQP
jgi:hypothetical protein